MKYRVENDKVVNSIGEVVRPKGVQQGTSAKGLWVNCTISGSESIRVYKKDCTLEAFDLLTEV